MKKAFTMLELIFVIVIIGILSAIAVPRLSVTRDEAVISKGKAQISSIRSGISMQKSRNMIEGIYPYYPTILDNANDNVEHEKLFYFSENNKSNILKYPIYSKKSGGHWWKSSDTNYTFYITQEDNVTFTYNPNSGLFDCDHTKENCKQLAE